MAVLGILAAILVLIAYWGLESGRLKASDPRYYVMNGVSSMMLIVAILFEFDAADSGAVFMEVCWLLISTKGFFKALKEKKSS